MERHAYREGEAELEGLVARPEAGGARPCVLIAHPWYGITPFVEAQAKRLAGLGYVAFALDVYGRGRRASSAQEARALMMPWIEDRRALRQRLAAAVAAARDLGGVDPGKLALIGYCFGGLCALELMRSGADVKAVVSFHGLLHTPLPVKPGEARASVLVCHGDQDPMAPAEDVDALRAELTRAGADWQLHTYGGAMHAFTDPEADTPEMGLAYDERAERRSWRAMTGLFGEVLG